MLNSTRMTRPPSVTNMITRGHDRTGGVKHQMKPPRVPPRCLASLDVRQIGSI
jgi:hypothetical protein